VVVAGYFGSMRSEAAVKGKGDRRVSFSGLLCWVLGMEGPGCGITRVWDC
jgi:hypothetical protein